jgi:hypothetical protein
MQPFNKYLVSSYYDMGAAIFEDTEINENTALAFKELIL